MSIIIDGNGEILRAPETIAENHMIRVNAEEERNIRGALPNEAKIDLTDEEVRDMLTAVLDKTLGDNDASTEAPKATTNELQDVLNGNSARTEEQKPPTDQGNGQGEESRSSTTNRQSNETEDNSAEPPATETTTEPANSTDEAEAATNNKPPAAEAEATSPPAETVAETDNNEMTSDVLPEETESGAATDQQPAAESDRSNDTPPQERSDTTGDEVAPPSESQRPSLEDIFRENQDTDITDDDATQDASPESAQPPVVEEEAARTPETPDDEATIDETIAEVERDIKKIADEIATQYGSKSDAAVPQPETPDDVPETSAVQSILGNSSNTQAADDEVADTPSTRHHRGGDAFRSPGERLDNLGGAEALVKELRVAHPDMSENELRAAIDDMINPFDEALSTATQERLDRQFAQNNGVAAEVPIEVSGEEVTAADDNIGVALGEEFDAREFVKDVLNGSSVQAAVDAVTAAEYDVDDEARRDTFRTELSYLQGTDPANTALPADIYTTTETDDGEEVTVFEHEVLEPLRQQHEDRLTQLEEAANGFVAMEQFTDRDTALSAYSDEAFDTVLSAVQRRAATGQERLDQLEAFGDFLTIDTHFDDNIALAAMDDEAFDALRETLEQLYEVGTQRQAELEELITHGSLDAYVERFDGIEGIQDITDNQAYQEFKQWIEKEEVTTERKGILGDLVTHGELADYLTEDFLSGNALHELSSHEFDAIVGKVENAERRLGLEIERNDAIASFIDQDNYGPIRDDLRAVVDELFDEDIGNMHPHVWSDKENALRNEAQALLNAHETRERRKAEADAAVEALAQREREAERQTTREAEQNNEFVFYQQGDNRWRGSSFGSSNLARSGCGPTSVAMAASTLTGEEITPKQVGADMGRYYVPGAGASWNLFTEGIKVYDLESKAIGTNFAAAREALENNTTDNIEAVIIASCRGAAPCTNGGHIIAIDQFDDGVFGVGDPAREYRHFSEEHLRRQNVRNMWVVRKTN